ncbi:RsiW-degrading membrane proteinase PrsW (M82 family) [Murinocardiopsis flavida]|uniref:RsiW-degrading membrane proteinase PrsW (M82 family) n=1 Tax=Murinocardiopsis flavida TaxID=645275 RepID=A0A2P8DML4_9ACTN|nr:PrsW family glutamic-type intramembrane protease [Murinocardiopsis flavida]PSK98449.1 RsiW-degrading membrane proteinase PrsW (M82 family) [Murinocardiopsis flavida]
MSHARPYPGTAPPAQPTVPPQRASGPWESGPQRGAGASPRHARAALPALTARLAYIVLCAAGLVILLRQYGPAARVFPVEAVTAFVLLAAALAIGAWALCRIRPVRPPSAGSAAAAVAWGVTAPVGLAMVANQALIGMWSKGAGLAFAADWAPALSAPLNEEVLKLAGVVLIAVAAPWAVRGPVDGFILGALVGLGFQMVENATYALNLVMQQGATDGLQSTLLSVVLRVGLTGLGTHWAMSAVAGTAVGILAAERWRPGRRRAAGAAVLVLVAVALHWFFDAPLLGGSVAGTLVKVAAGFCTAMVVYFAVRHGYRRRVRRALADAGEALDLHRSDALALARRSGRRKALLRVPLPDRPAAESRQRELLATAERRADAEE